jgi:hypothetical protein
MFIKKIILLLMVVLVSTSVFSISYDNVFYDLYSNVFYEQEDYINDFKNCNNQKCYDKIFPKLEDKNVSNIYVEYHNWSKDYVFGIIENDNGFMNYQKNIGEVKILIDGFYPVYVIYPRKMNKAISFETKEVRHKNFEQADIIIPYDSFNNDTIFVNYALDKKKFIMSGFKNFDFNVGINDSDMKNMRDKRVNETDEITNKFIDNTFKDDRTGGFFRAIINFLKVPYHSRTK